MKEFSRNDGEVQSQLRCLINSQEGLPTGNAKAEFFIFLNFFLDKLKCAKSTSLSSGRKKMKIFGKTLIWVDIRENFISLNLKVA